MVGFEGYVTNVDKRKGTDPWISGYEWSFQCTCGAIGEPESSLKHGDVMECSECDREWQIGITEK